MKINNDPKISQAFAYLKNLKYTDTDIQEICKDYIIADYLGKNYIGTSKLLPIIKTKQKNKSKFKISYTKNTFKIDAKGEFLAVIMKKHLSNILKKANNNNISVLLVKNAKTTPLPSVYSYLATKENLMVFSCMFIPSKTVVMPNLLTPMFDTNPISIGIPLGNNKGFIFDFSVAESAIAKISILEKFNGLTKNLSITNDKSEIKYLFPFGNIKGFNFGILTLMLAGILNDKDVFLEEDYKNKKEASFFYLFINANFLEKNYKMKMLKMLKKIYKESGSYYHIPGEKYEKAFNNLKKYFNYYFEK